MYKDRGDFWKGVSELGSLRNITNGKRLHDIFDNIPIEGKYKYIEELNGNPERILQNYELMDLLTYCNEAIGMDNISMIEETMK